MSSFMALRLRVVSEHRRSLGDRGSAVFGHEGGTIGRAADNDWVLPDPLRYVSAHHARVAFRDGHYVVEDLSTNGAFVNDDDRPIAKMGPYRLGHGDVLRLGEYQIVVALDAEGEAPVNPIDAVLGVPTSIHALRPVGRVAQTDIGEMLDLDALLETGVGHEFAAQPAAPMEGSERRLVAGGAESLLGDEPTDSAIKRRIARLARAVAREPAAAGVPASAPAEMPGHFAAFCRGAGMNAERLPADAQSRAMHLVGQLLREALVGLKDLDRSRQEIRNRFRIEIPADPEDPRPAFARYTVDELLIELFNRHETRRMDAVLWLREALNAAKEHEAAVAQATRTAFIEFLDRLDPKELAARFEKAARRKGEANYWELYAEFYRNLLEMPADQLPHTFVEAFARTYRGIVTGKSTG